MYDFTDQLEKQKEAFEACETWLINRTHVDKVEKAALEDDLAGVDLWVYCPVRMAFQVKTDFRADETGNMAYEVVSQAPVGGGKAKLGWGLHLARVDYLVYILGISMNLFIYPGAELYSFITHNYRNYRNFQADNGKYLTLGILVPIDDLSHLVHSAGNLLDLNPG